MKPQTLLAFLCLILITNLSHAALGDEGGHGGDGFEAKLNRARDLAIDIIESISTEYVLDSNINEVAKEIYSSHKDEYIAALREAKLVISFEPLYSEYQSTENEADVEKVRVEAIAFEQEQSIYFDRELLLNQQDIRIAELLLHEGGHLLNYGQDYEDTLWDLANLLSSLYTIAQNFPRDPFAAKQTCGLNGTLHDRLLDCEIKNRAYARRNVNGYTWKLVRRLSGKLDAATEAWMDMTSGIIWGQVYLSGDEALKQLHGQAHRTCANDEYLTDLPLLSDIAEAKPHGLLQVVPGFSMAGSSYFAPFWLQEFLYAIRSDGEPLGVSSSTSLAFRCIARTH